MRVTIMGKCLYAIYTTSPSTACSTGLSLSTTTKVEISV